MLRPGWSAAWRAAVGPPSPSPHPTPPADAHAHTHTERRMHPAATSRRSGSRRHRAAGGTWDRRLVRSAHRRTLYVPWVTEAVWFANSKKRGIYRAPCACVTSCMKQVIVAGVKLHRELRTGGRILTGVAYRYCFLSSPSSFSSLCQFL